MKTKTKHIAAILACAVLLAAGVLAGCAARKEAPMAYDGSMLYEETAVHHDKLFDFGNLSASNHMEMAEDQTVAGGGAQDGRAVIATANISIQTKTYDAFSAALKAELKTMGGYTNAFDEWNYDSNRHASVTARVPSQKLDAFLDSLEENGTVISRSINTADVTDEMIETGSRKQALQAEEAALLTILEKAQTVEDIIRVQDRLSNVRSELESYLQKLQSLQNQVAYSTVNIDVQEVNRITTPTQKFGALASSGFLASLRNIGSGLRNFALWFIGAIPWLVLLAIPTVLVIWFIRRRRRNKNAKKAAMDA